jgi:hypothetical protein
MAGLVPAIHAFLCNQGVDARDIGERSDAVLRTAKRGHDVEKLTQVNWKPIYRPQATLQPLHQRMPAARRHASGAH